MAVKKLTRSGKVVLLKIIEISTVNLFLGAKGAVAVPDILVIYITAWIIEVWNREIKYGKDK